MNFFYKMFKGTAALLLFLTHVCPYLYDFMNFISSDTYNSLFASGLSPGILYGLLKTHKTNNPVRPIFSAINTLHINYQKILFTYFMILL